jgi:hypothetical protein
MHRVVRALVRETRQGADIVPGLYDVLTYKQKAQGAEMVFHRFQLRRGV